MRDNVASPHAVVVENKWPAQNHGWIHGLFVADVFNSNFEKWGATERCAHLVGDRTESWNVFSKALHRLPTNFVYASRRSSSDLSISSSQVPREQLSLLFTSPKRTGPLRSTDQQYSSLVINFDRVFCKCWAS